MPNYDKIVQDTSTGQYWGKTGGAWVKIPAAAAQAEQPGPVKRLLTQTVGLPEDVDTSLSTAKKDLSSMASDPLGTLIKALKQGASSLNPLGGMSEARESAERRFSSPGAGNKMQGAIEWLESGFPYAGPAAVRSSEQTAQGDVAGGIGSAIQAALLHRAAPEIAVKMGTGPLRTAAQFASGVGTDAIEKSRNNFTESLNKLNADIAEAQQKNAANKSGVLERGELEGTSQKTAQSLGNALQTMREHETAVAKALYPDIQGAADPATLQKGLQAAIDKNLRGSEKVPPVLSRILKETSEVPGKSTGPAIQGRTLDLSNPNDLLAYQRYKAQGVFAPEEVERIEGKNAGGLDFDKLHGYYSELGRESRNPNLPGDERATNAAAREVVGNEMQRMAEAENKSYRFGVAQKNWARLENTFYNTSTTNGSPIARALRRVDPITKQVRPEEVQAILSSPRSYAIAQRLLSQYKSGTDVQAALQLMREQMAQAKTLPKTVKELPVPKGPTREIFDPVAARREILQNRVPPPVTPSLFWKYTMLRSLMRKLANIPSVQDWLSQNPS